MSDDRLGDEQVAEYLAAPDGFDNLDHFTPMEIDGMKLAREVQQSRARIAELEANYKGVPEYITATTRRIAELEAENARLKDECVHHTLWDDIEAERALADQLAAAASQAVEVGWHGYYWDYDNDVQLTPTSEELVEAALAAHTARRNATSVADSQGREATE